jgi:hypothetical protein
MPRIHVRVDDDLYERLRLFAQGRKNGHGTTAELSPIVREALEHYLKPASRATRGQARRTSNVRRN